MKKLLALVAISALVTGCASTPSDPFAKFAPWKPVAVSAATDIVYLVEPSSKKQVAPGVYKIWTKNTKDLNTWALDVVDCNSEQTATSQIVMFNNKGIALVPIKIDSKFSKPIFGTVGYGIITYICK